MALVAPVAVAMTRQEAQGCLRAKGGLPFAFNCSGQSCGLPIRWGPPSFLGTAKKRRTRRGTARVRCGRTYAEYRGEAFRGTGGAGAPHRRCQQRSNTSNEQDFNYLLFNAGESTATGVHLIGARAGGFSTAGITPATCSGTRGGPIVSDCSRMNAVSV